MNDETKLPFAKAFWELRVYERARDLQGGVFRASRAFPTEEKYSLTDQLRRAARSIGAQIAEAWGKRDYIKHFQSKLSDAESENNETQHWLISAVDDGYLDSNKARPPLPKISRNRPHAQHHVRPRRRILPLTSLNQSPGTLPRILPSPLTNPRLHPIPPHPQLHTEY